MIAKRIFDRPRYTPALFILCKSGERNVSRKLTNLDVKRNEADNEENDTRSNYRVDYLKGVQPCREKLMGAIFAE